MSRKFGLVLVIGAVGVLGACGGGGSGSTASTKPAPVTTTAVASPCGGADAIEGAIRASTVAGLNQV